MRLFRNALIRAMIVVLVAILVRGLATSFSLDEILGTLLHMGVPLTLGLAIYAKLGPRRETRADRALYPTLYGWALWMVIDWLWDLSSVSLFDELFSHGIRIPLEFLIAYPVLWALDLVWRPQEQKPVDPTAPPPAR